MNDASLISTTELIPINHDSDIITIKKGGDRSISICRNEFIENQRYICSFNNKFQITSSLSLSLYIYIYIYIYFIERIYIYIYTFNKEKFYMIFTCTENFLLYIYKAFKVSICLHNASHNK